MDDRLSFLPLELRDHILFFLPTKDAIKTTILSSRWKNVCSTLSRLEFSQYNFSSKNRDSPNLREKNFIEYVHQTLSHHNDTNINKFNLILDMVDSNNFLSHLNDWVSFALSHNAHKICLTNYGISEVPNIPLFLFTSNSLTELSIYDVILTLSINIKFPNLRRLKLKKVELLDVNVTNQLLSSSTVLETLEMILCSWQNPFDTLLIPSPKLKVLEMIGHYHFREIQPISTYLYKLVYSCPPNSYINPSLSLKDVSLCPRILSATTGPWASKIIKSLCNVVDLYLGDSFVELLVKEGHLLWSRLPTSCYSLEKLSLDVYPAKYQVQGVMMPLLRRFPRLQTLCIHVKGPGIVEDYLNMNEDWETEEINADDCALKRLKTVDIEECTESEMELDIARYLLKNGPALERMNIKLRLRLRQKYLKDKTRLISLCERIQKYTRASPHVTILVLSKKPWTFESPIFRDIRARQRSYAYGKIVNNSLLLLE